MPKRAVPREPESCDFPEIRTWYGEIQERLVREPDIVSGDVIASWTRIARPLAGILEKPSTDGPDASDGPRVRADDGHLLQLAADERPQTEYDGPMSWASPKVVSFDRAGAYVRSDGRTIRDREQALADLDRDDWAADLVRAFFPSGRDLGSRKGAMTPSLVRALALWSLRGVGLRRAARCVIVWDAEFGPGVANPEAAAMVRHYQAGEPEDRDQSQARENIEAALITASHRIWDTIGLTSETAFRI